MKIAQMKISAWIIFSGDDEFDFGNDPDGAEIALRNAGYEVTRLPTKYRTQLAHPDDDFMLVSTVTEKTADFIFDELNAIVGRYGALADDVGTVAPDFVPADEFERLFKEPPPREHLH